MKNDWNEYPTKVGFNGRYILDEGGNPVPEPDLLKWAGWMETAKRHIGHTIREKDTTEIRVSTVFLGLDYNLAGGEPLLYETMVFGGEMDGEMERYSTKDEALKGHKEMCEKVFEEPLGTLPRGLIGEPLE